MLQVIKKFIRNLLFELKEKSKLPSYLFFLFFPDFMKSEIERTISGLLKYQDNEHSINEYKLRRNIHRLEKGICSKNRRELFGLGFIEDTVNEYIKLSGHTETNMHNLIYYNKILTDYFEVVNNKNEIIKKSYHKFKKYANNNLENNLPKLLHLKEIDETLISNFNSLVKSRRSVRYYSTRALNFGKIEAALMAAAEAPSACNRYPFKYYVFTNKAKILKLLEFAHGFQGEKENVPGLLVLVGDLSAYETVGDRHLIFIDSSLGLMNFILSLHSQGIGSCILNFSENYIVEKQIQEMLKLDKFQKVITLVSFGYPNYTIPVPFSIKNYNNYELNSELISDIKDLSISKIENISCSIE